MQARKLKNVLKYSDAQGSNNDFCTLIFTLIKYFETYSILIVTNTCIYTLNKTQYYLRLEQVVHIEK